MLKKLKGLAIAMLLLALGTAALIAGLLLSLIFSYLVLAGIAGLIIWFLAASIRYEQESKTRTKERDR